MFILYEIPERLKEQEGRAITIMLSRRRSPRHDAPTDHAPYVGIEPRLTRLARPAQQRTLRLMGEINIMAWEDLDRANHPAAQALWELARKRRPPAAV
jgi:hypothetical protein